MKTVDIHTHLLNPNARFQRFFDKLTIRFYGSGFGWDRKALQADPYTTYVETMARSVRESRYVEKACLFGIDSRLDKRGREIDRDRTVCAMTEDVLAVTEKYPQQFIPFFSVNPLRPGALDLIDEYVEKGCRGAKFLQNYWRIDLNDEQFVPYYEKIRQHKIPLIIHVGSEYSIDSNARFEGIDMLDLPLACGVTVIAAHMALGRFNYKLRLWRNLSRDPRYFDEDYFLLLEKLQQHENLYADISAMLVPLRARALRHLSKQIKVHHKILFGTDYPVPFPICHNTYDLTADRRKRIGSIHNPFDRYTSAILEYFPAENPVYDNYRKLLLDI
jgi:predicted TIM-barrel fold metal-dependent hydrolase